MVDKIIRNILYIAGYKMKKLTCYNKLYYSITFLIICLIVFVVSIPSYKRFERIFLTSLEINKIYEKWLIVKNETVKYLFLEDNIHKKPYGLIDSVSDYEIAMEQILDKKMFDQIADDILLYNELANMIYIWQDIQFKLIKSIFFNNDINFFVNEIFTFIIKTDDFEISMKNNIYFINRHLDKKVKLNWILFVVSICITVFLILLFRNLSFSYFKVKEKEKEIRTLSKSIMEVRDKERIRIAADLHDVIIQNLVVIRNYCNELLWDDDQDSKTLNKIKKVKTITDKNIGAVREISFNLRPPELTDSLCESIEIFSNEIASNTGIDVKFYPLGFNGYIINQDLEIVIYRLICEAVNNVLKHAHASVIIIKIILFFPNIIIKIEDNGVGFLPYEKVKTKEHMGIQGMKDRVALVEGTMEIKPGKKSGIVVTFKIPCKGLVKENEKV